VTIVLKNEEIAAKIFFEAYLHPGKYNIYQMDKKIFGKHTNRVYKAIKHQKLVERGYLRLERIQGDGRDQNMIYPGLDPLLTTIRQKTMMTPLEQNILEKLLGSKFFRYLVSNINIDINYGMSSLFYIILMNLDYWSTFYLKNTTLLTFGTYIEDHISTVEEYDQFLKIIKDKFDEMEYRMILKWLRSYDSLLPILNIIENQQESQKIYDVVKDSLFLFFIPKNLMKKIRGISIIGRMDIIFSSLYSDVRHVEKFTEYVMSKIKTLQLPTK
jgi:hypothetical protein